MTFDLPKPEELLDAWPPDRARHADECRARSRRGRVLELDWIVCPRCALLAGLEHLSAKLEEEPPAF